MIRPPLLESGDTIGIIAPARSISRKELNPFLEWTAKEGFLVRSGKQLLEKYHQFAGTDRQRRTDLEDMIRDDAVKAIIAARGGYGSARILEDLDLRILAEHPKWICGFSDITALHSAFNQVAGIETLHTWMPYSLYLHNDYDPESVRSLKEVLVKGQIRYRLSPGAMSIEGIARGVLTGGNLSVLQSLSGTPYESDYEGKILFLEDVDEYLYHVDRMVLHLEMRGIFNMITGLIIGSFTDMKDNEIPFGRTAVEIIAERAQKYNIPVLFDFPAGHEKHNHTLIFGRQVTLTVKKTEATLDF